MVIRASKRIVKLMPSPRDMVFLPIIALRSVTSKSELGVYASSDLLFKGAVFGRDSLDVAEDLMKSRPQLVKKILLTLAALQGQTNDYKNEEEPGKIIHEYRTTIVDGKNIDHASRIIFDNLSQKWGGDDKELVYYGSVDSTPHFLKTLHAYCQEYGDDILLNKVKLRNGREATVLETAERASQWLIGKINASRSGLVEYQRANSHGLANQVWKDSDEFYVHEDGQLANHDAPISSIEVQALTYDGLMACAEFFPAQAESLRRSAFQLRDRTIDLLWIPKLKRFALGTDIDEDGRIRIIKTETANPAALLDSSFFDDLTDSELRHKFILPIVEQIMGSNFLTDAGIRSRSLAAAHLVKFWDYHGSFVSWPKETYDIAKGLRRQGFPLLANQLENRLLNVYLKIRKYPEFIYVDGHGRVLASSSGPTKHGEFTLINGPNSPENVQAWTVSAIIAILSSRFALKNMVLIKEPKREVWMVKKERQIMANTPKIGLYLNPFSLAARYPNYRYKISGVKSS